MQTNNFPDYDLDRIEREARRMRAEVMAKSTSRAYAWVKSLLVARPKADRQPT